MSKKNSIKFSVVRAIAALAIALVVTFLLIFLSADGASIGERLSNTMAALQQMLVRPFFKKSGNFATKNFCDILAGMIPIMFTGLATCIMFSANQFNLGAEGGIMLGAFVTAVVAIYVPLPGALLPIVAILAGGLAVALIMLVPAVLKAKLGVSEMVNSLMLNYIIMYILNFLMNAHLADRSKGITQTYPFRENAILPQIVDNGSRFSWGWDRHYRSDPVLVLHVQNTVGLQHSYDGYQSAVRDVFRHERGIDHYPVPGSGRFPRRSRRRH